MIQAELNTEYYKEMLKKDRLIPVFIQGEFKGLITFFIGDESEEDRYIRDDMWSVVEENNPNGEVLYIDQFLSDHDVKNARWGVYFWNKLIIYIKERFPQIKIIRWNRFKNNKVNTYRKRIR